MWYSQLLDPVLLLVAMSTHFYFNTVSGSSDCGCSSDFRPCISMKEAKVQLNYIVSIFSVYNNDWQCNLLCFQDLS